MNIAAIANVIYLLWTSVPIRVIHNCTILLYIHLFHFIQHDEKVILSVSLITDEEELSLMIGTHLHVVMVIEGVIVDIM